MIEPLSRDFHLVIPSIPGYGFSGPTHERGWDIVHIELPDTDEARLDKVRQLMANRPPYQALQAATPQTIGYALTDSPVGQLAWIAERFAKWTDPRSQIRPGCFASSA
nr:hypothetical protein [Streptomyces hainanensis]